MTTTAGPAGPPERPTNVRVAVRGSSGLVIVWDRPPSEAGIAAYHVMVGDAGQPARPVLRTLTEDVTVAALEPGRTYLVVVQAVDVNGELSGFSDTLHAQTAPLTLSRQLTDLPGRLDMLTGRVEALESGPVRDHTHTVGTVGTG